jgi:DNA-binding response OmpR family regulator
MPGSTAPCRILVAEDEPLVGRVFRESLVLSGYAVDLSEDGRDALCRYRPGSYDLLILDSKLARRSGLEVVVQLRDAGDPIPIILTSAAAAGMGRMEPFAFTYRVELLRKPFGVRDLRRAVDRAIGPPIG